MSKSVTVRMLRAAEVEGRQVAAGQAIRVDAATALGVIHSGAARLDSMDDIGALHDLAPNVDPLQRVVAAVLGVKISSDQQKLVPVRAVDRRPLPPQSIFHATAESNAGAIVNGGFRSLRPGQLVFFAAEPVTADMLLVRSADICVVVDVPGDVELNQFLVERLPRPVHLPNPKWAYFLMLAGAAPGPRRCFAISADIVNEWPRRLRNLPPLRSTH